MRKTKTKDPTTDDPGRTTTDDPGRTTPTPHPTKIKKCSKVKVSCEAQGYNYLNFVADVSDETSTECPHLQSTQYIKKNTNAIRLQDTFLDELVEMKRLTTETRQKLRQIKYKSDSLGHILASA